MTMSAPTGGGAALAPLQAAALSKAARAPNMDLPLLPMDPLILDVGATLASPFTAVAPRPRARHASPLRSAGDQRGPDHQPLQVRGALAGPGAGAGDQGESGG